MNKNAQYEESRRDNSTVWSVLDIDGEDAYDEIMNTIRVRKPSGTRFRLFLAFTGSFIEPDPVRFKVMAMYATNTKPKSKESIINGIAFLLDGQRFEEWKLKAESVPTAKIGTTGEAGKSRDVVIKGKGGKDAGGISLRDDGTILLKARGSEIVMGDGIVIKGQINREHPETRNAILKSNPLRSFCLPSFCVLPIPSEIPTTRMITNIGGIVKSVIKLSQVG